MQNGSRLASAMNIESLAQRKCFVLSNALRFAVAVQSAVHGIIMDVSYSVEHFLLHNASSKYHVQYFLCTRDTIFTDIIQAYIYFRPQYLTYCK